MMFESGAILEYLIEKYGKGRLAPAIGSPDRGPYLQWVHFAEATAFPPIGESRATRMFLPEAERIPKVAADGRVRAKNALDVLERTLAGKQYLVGNELSGADIMMGYFLMARACSARPARASEHRRLLGTPRGTPGLSESVKRLVHCPRR